MNNQTFDEALQRIVAGENLPYPHDAWRGLSARLDAHDGRKRKVFALTPALRWAAAAVLIGLALGAGWLLRGEREEQRGAGPVAQHGMPGSTRLEENTAPTPAFSKATPAKNVATARARNTRHTHESSTIARRKKNDNTDAPPINTTPFPAPQAASPMTAKRDEPTLPTAGEEAPKPRPARSSRTPNIAFDNGDDAHRASGRSTAFDINGGYGFSSSLSAFTVGVAVKRNLSSRLRLEGGLALVGGTQSTKVNVVETGFTASSPGLGGQVGAAVVQTDSAYVQPGSERLLYLQAAPTLSYRIYKGFSAGAGVDAQRLLGAPRSAAVEYTDAYDGTASVAASSPLQADWDFGFAVRADYQLTKALRVGIQHRESLRATASGQRADGRSYWLLQAGVQLR